MKSKKIVPNQMFILNCQIINK